MNDLHYECVYVMVIKMTDYELENGIWKKSVVEMDKDGNESVKMVTCLITDIPVDVLLMEWEDLVTELSAKEVAYFNLKEYYESESHHLETTVDFKELYGKNNADVRKHHIKMELSDVYDEMKDLEFGINWIRQYIPLLKEVIRSKQ